AVREALALARVSPGGEARLVAYVVPRSGGEPGLATELRSFLRERLPEAMVPGAFVFLDALPLTANGKVDRRALPDPETERAAVPAASAVPRSAVEELLADLFAEVLGLDRVGIHDDFFDLGGHSLLATRVIARVRRVFGVGLELRAVFEQRTVAALAARIEAALRGDRGAEEPSLEPAVRPAEGAPLSFAQESLWVIEQLAPGSTAYHVPRRFHLRGGLAVEALAAALSEIERRHEVLRTVFDVVAETPVQRAFPAARRPLPVLDLSALPEALRRAEAERLGAEEAGRPFDFYQGPLVRTALLRLAAGEHVLLYTTHHIVSDAGSLGVLLGELAALYGAAREGRPSPLPEPRLQYADFALWQRRWLTDERLGERIAWWREHLAGRPEGLDLPADRPRPAVRSGRGAVAEVSVPGDVATGLERLGRRHGATLFVTVAAAFETLLHRVTGEEDLLVGTATAGRDRTELEGLIGFFANTVVLRGNLAGDPSFADLLSRVREAALGAFAHQDLPFEKLVEALAPRRDLSRNPLFEVLFSLDRASALSPELAPGLSLDLEEAAPGSAKLDLTLALARTEEGIAGAAEYSTDLFDAATVERLLSGFGALLSGIVADPGARLSDLPLLNREERAELALRSAGPERRFAAEIPLQELFEAQARRTPSALAVIAEDETLTYRELDLRANRLAWLLRAHGVGPESRVGLCLERSAGMVVALVAALKAGGAYIPLDPEYPAERLAFLVADAGVHVLLAQERTAGSLPEHGAPVVFVETGAFAEGEEGGAPPPRLYEGGEALAYVIYTSGSTGRPKGALIPHRAIVNHMLWMAEDLPLTPADRVFQKTPFGFDASVWEFWAPLAAGAALVMARPGGHRDPAYLVRTIAEHGVTVLQAVPSLLLAI
ncbi:MAG TPA: condensation domain-containing protein, partial [Thermoanaerobaculia bacterium]|nr:condensation domain-containing protein [Thermoanaerobaculia bacterium]